MYSALMKYIYNQIKLQYIILRETCNNYICAVIGADYSISPTIFTSRAGDPAEIVANFRVDNIAQEINGTAQLRLMLTLGTFPPEAIFVDTIELVIEDSDGK